MMASLADWVKGLLVSETYLRLGMVDPIDKLDLTGFPNGWPYLRL